MISSYSGLMSRLAQLSLGRPGTGDSAAKVATDIKTYVGMVLSQNYESIMDANAFDDPDATAGVYNQIVKDCPPKVTVTIQQTIVPDPTRTFALKAENNALYNDALTFGTDSNGFLTNGAPTSVSQIPTIAGSIASDIGSFVGVTPAAAPSPDLKAEIKIPGLGKAKPSCPTSDTWNTEADNLGKSPTASTGEIAFHLSQCLPKPGSLKNLPSSMLPITFYATVETFNPPSAEPKAGVAIAAVPTADVADSGGSLADVAGLGAFAKKYLALNMQLYCSARFLDPTNLQTTPAAGQGTTSRITRQSEKTYAWRTPDSSGEVEDPATWDDAGRRINTGGIYEGIVTSAPRACLFLATQTRPSLLPVAPGADDGTSTIEVARTYLWAMDSRYLTILPTQRGLLVARSVAYTFANGQPTGVTDSRPSEVAALFALPSSVAGALLSGLTNAYATAQAKTNAQNANLTAQTAYLSAQASYLQAQATLKTATAASPSK
jgi:hypothetical protein